MLNHSNGLLAGSYKKVCCWDKAPEVDLYGDPLDLANWECWRIILASAELAIYEVWGLQIQSPVFYSVASLWMHCFTASEERQNDCKPEQIVSSTFITIFVVNVSGTLSLVFVECVYFSGSDTKRRRLLSYSHLKKLRLAQLKQPSMSTKPDPLKFL